MISHFNRACLGQEGYIILIEDQDVKLPCMPPSLTPWVTSLNIYKWSSRGSRRWRNWVQKHRPFQIQGRSFCTMWWKVRVPKRACCNWFEQSIIMPCRPEAINLSNVAQMLGTIKALICLSSGARDSCLYYFSRLRVQTKIQVYRRGRQSLHHSAGTFIPRKAEMCLIQR